MLYIVTFYHDNFYHDLIVFMTTWYNFLTRVVGGGVGTGIVLAKCALDQLFFATQQGKFHFLKKFMPRVNPP